MCTICKAIEFKSDPVHQVALQMVFNGQKTECDMSEDFSLVACFREGMRAAMGMAEPLCQNHQTLLSMMGSFAKAKS